MAVAKLLLSQARRLSLSRPPSPLLPLHRSLCFSSSSQPNATPDPPQAAESRPAARTTIPIQPVSYAPKPEDHPQQEQQQQEQEASSTPTQTQARPISGRRPPPSSPVQATRSAWTREDLRYVKDTPDIAPVSYAPRVAPLPEYRAGAPGEDGEEERIEEKQESVEMGREERRMETESRMRRSAFKIATEEEKVMVPFPLLIKPEKKTVNRPVFDLMEAIREVKAKAKAGFDETVEAHARLAIDPKRSELIVRGTMALPHGAKKDIRVAVFAEGADADDARAAGADIVGGVELVEEIARTGKIEFDRCFSTDKFKRGLLKISKILNDHGLMPNPKEGTLVKDVSKAVKEAKQGQVKFRMDKTSIVHVGIGKVSFSEDLLRDNVGSFMSALLQAKPAGLKKTSKYAGYVNSFHICSTMGPGFSVSIQSLSRAADQYSKVYLSA